MLDALASSGFAGRSVWLTRGALALAGLAAAIALLRLLALIALGPDLPTPARVDPMATPEVAAEPAQSVAAWHLFGNAQGPIDLAALAQTAPATALKLTLRGTLNESAPEGGVAIIADESGRDQAYRVGDTLPGDARLEGIYSGRVLLSRGGVNESLSLPREAGSDVPVVTPVAAPNAPRNPNPVPAIKFPGSASTPFVAPSMAPGGPSLDSFRAATLPDVEALAKEVQIYPVMENGRMAGVRLAAGRDSDVLSRVGIQPNDIVTTVNGIPLDGPARSAELMTALKDARSVQVTVRRDGKDIPISIGLK